MKAFLDKEGVHPQILLTRRLVEGDNRPSLGHAISLAFADAGINMDFVVGQVVGKKDSAIFGFDTEEDATKSTALIRKAAAGKKG